MLKSEQMGERTINPGEDSYELHRVRPFHSPTAQVCGNRHVEQSAGAQQVSLSLRRAASLIAFNRGLSKCRGQLIRNLERMLPGRNIHCDVVHRRQHYSPPVSSGMWPILRALAHCCFSSTYVELVLL